jgi:hypothetical protein
VLPDFRLPLRSAVASCWLAPFDTAIMTDKLPIHAPLEISTPGALIWVGVVVLGAAIATACPPIARHA